MNMIESVTSGAIQKAAKKPFEPVRIQPADPWGSFNTVISPTSFNLC